MSPPDKPCPKCGHRVLGGRWFHTPDECAAALKQGADCQHEYRQGYCRKCERGRSRAPVSKWPKATQPACIDSQHKDLEAENERLRTALQEIVAAPYQAPATRLRQIAAAVLARGVP